MAKGIFGGERKMREKRANGTETVCVVGKVGNEGKCSICLYSVYVDKRVGE